MRLSIYMYHYVRNVRTSRFPGIKGLETDRFVEQVRYLRTHHNIIGADDLLAAVDGGLLHEIPPRAALLTFDDGYIDHFTQVFPVLERERVPGAFFPSAACILEDRVLDVNKIHFLLAAGLDPQTLIDHIFTVLDRFGGQYLARGEYWAKLAVADRFDPKEIVFIKRALQRELPVALRQMIVTELFERYVTSDEATFARELYMTIDQLKTMRANHMYVGSHGYHHLWLNSVPPPEQRQEVDRALEFLRGVGTRTDRWIMSYPFGGYDDSLIAIVRDAGGTIGLTTRVGIADLGRDHLLTLPRLDTHDVPMHGHSDPQRGERGVSKESYQMIGDQTVSQEA